MAADHDHDGHRIDLAQPLERLESVDPRHLHVEKDEMRAEALILRDTVGRVVRRAHLVALELEELSERLANPRLVVDDQNFSGHQGTVAVL